MHFSTAVASIATLATTVLAVPPPPTGVHAIAVNGKSDFFPKQNFKTALTAAHNKFYLNEPHPEAKCAGHAEIAFFRIDDKTGSLYLYNTDADAQEQQQVYVLPTDKDSWEVGYYTGIPRKSPPGTDFKGWTIDKKNNLVWRGQNLFACPNQADGSWHVSLSRYGNPGCTHFEAYAPKAQYPNSCEYSNQ